MEDIHEAKNSGLKKKVSAFTKSKKSKHNNEKYIHSTGLSQDIQRQ